MPAPIVAAAAAVPAVATAVPAAVTALGPFVQASAEVAKSAVAQLSIALQQPLWKREVVRQRKRGVETTTTSMPAWLIVGGFVGGAVTLWVLGLGIGTHDGKVSLVERPRLTLPFAPRSGGQASEGFVPDWIPIFGAL